MPQKKDFERHVVKIPTEYTDALIEKGLAWKKSDGRVDGISHAINKSLSDYLRRI
jgi:hypothetical protein